MKTYSHQISSRLFQQGGEVCFSKPSHTFVARVQVYWKRVTKNHLDRICQDDFTVLGLVKYVLKQQQQQQLITCITGRN